MASSSSSSPPASTTSTSTTSVQRVPRRPFGTETTKSSLPLTVPIIGLGCSSFSTFFWTPSQHEDNIKHWTPETIDRNHPQVQEWIQTIQFCIIECGITLLDTAPWYGHGTSEVVIGWAMEELLLKKNNIKRQDLTINTKIGRYEADPKLQFDFSKDKTLQSAQRSLQRLKCEYIDVLQLHDPEFAPSLQQLLNETIPALMECKNRGYCLALGMTGYPLEIQYQLLQATMENYQTNIWDQALTYGHFNLHDTSLVSQPIPNADNNLSYCEFVQHHQNMGLLAAAPLSMGLLSDGDPPSWHPASAELQAACANAAAICNSRNVTMATLAVLVALSEPKIPCTILGMKDREEARMAATIANRFQGIDTKSTSQEGILKQVLTPEEHQAWTFLSDPNDGPFATIWKNGNYKWDGIQCARDFWSQVDGVTPEDWYINS